MSSRIYCAMMTVADALQLEVLKTARVAAGHGGLHRPVAWVHNVALPDAAEWLNGGELVLIAARNLPEESEERERYLLAMFERGVAGLVVTVGNTIDTLPDYMCAIADRCDFPLIEISYEARFVDIARAANERIIQQNMAMVSRSLTIQQTLTQLVLDGGGIKELAQTLAGLINQSVSIETDRFEALASANIAPVDEARRYTQQYGRTDPRLVAALEAEILPEIHRTLRPVFIPAMPDVGLEMERILAPVVVHGEIYGYVWIIADDRPFSDLDHMAIEIGATIAALMLLYQESVQSAEASLKGNLLARLVQGEADAADVLTDQALRYGVDLRRSYRALLVDAPQATAQRPLGLYRRVNRLLSDGGHEALAGQFAGQVMLLTQDGEDMNRLAADIHKATNGGRLRVGVSAAHSGAENVALAHGQCREVLNITGRLGQETPTVYFDDLGYLHALYQAGPGALAGNAHVPALRILRREQQADLFHTLETYLDTGANGVSTAEMLHVHRSTLSYRLQRVSEICAVDLSDPAARLNLQVALKLLRLFDEG
jgi:PucR family transcriptional regulator, purine catabolism regulatory protein